MRPRRREHRYEVSGRRVRRVGHDHLGRRIRRCFIASAKRETGPMYEWIPARTWLLALAMLLITDTAGADHGAGIDVNVDPAIKAADAQPRWRYIGERTDTSAPCPGKQSLPDWTVQPLFCNPDPDNPDG